MDFHGTIFFACGLTYENKFCMWAEHGGFQMIERLPGFEYIWLYVTALLGLNWPKLIEA